MSRGITRPSLQSQATTAVSTQNIHTHVRSERSPRPSLRSQQSRLSISRNFSNIGRRVSLGESDQEDNSSVRSWIPTLTPAPDSQSLMREEGASVHSGSDVGEDCFFDFSSSEAMAFESQFDHEFDTVGDVGIDGTNEEALLAMWKAKLKHYLILSSAGKPIYSRHGDDQLISNHIGVIQTIISFYQGADDLLKSFKSEDAQFVILSKGHLHLVAISRLGESELQLRSQLEALYMQILSTLTLPKMEYLFQSRPSTDLRRPLEGTEVLLSALADGFTRGSPSSLLSSLECLRMRKTDRQLISTTLLKAKVPNLLYGLVVAGGRLVSVLRPKKHSLHPGDLQLIFNMLFEAEGVRAGGGENWIPVCLPGFNNTGYLYMYVSFLDVDASSTQPTENKSSSLPPPPAPSNNDSASATPNPQLDRSSEVAIVLISASKDSFYVLRGMRDALVAQLRANNSLSLIATALRTGRPACTDVLPGTSLRHFLLKSRANVQFVQPTLAPHFTTPIAVRRLVSLYGGMHAAVHGRGGAHLKVQHVVAKEYTALAWVTPLYEVYCVAGPGAGKGSLATAANRLLQWARREEERIFIVGGAVF